VTRMNEALLSRFASPDGWRLLKNLLGGVVILAVWLALWAWLAAGVVRPLSAVPRLASERAAAVDAL
jgi:hypothetical protein